MRELLRTALRIPPGWRVVHHTLFEIDPETLSAGDERWGWMVQDLLLLRHDGWDVQLDVGWLPDQQPSGQYRAQLILGDDWRAPFVRYETRSRVELVATVEPWLSQCPLLI